MLVLLVLLLLLLVLVLVLLLLLLLLLVVVVVVRPRRQERKEPTCVYSLYVCKVSYRRQCRRNKASQVTPHWRL